MWKLTSKGRSRPASWRCIKCTRDANTRTYHKHAEKRKAHNKDWVSKNAQRKRDTDAAWRAKNAEERRSYMKARTQERKELVLRHYGGICVCCEEQELKFLCLDHVDGGGNKHRAEVGGGTTFYNWIIRENFPAGFQVLCHNCNFAKGAYGSCPHDRHAWSQTQSLDGTSTIWWECTKCHSTQGGPQPDPDCKVLIADREVDDCVVMTKVSCKEAQVGQILAL